MHKAFIGIGTNLGDKIKNIDEALNRLKDKGLNIIKISSIIETEPYGYKNQDNFLNAVCLIETDLSPFELLDLLLEVEKEMGRVRTIKWGPRIIDLDIIFYDDLIINHEKLIIPHPDAHNRIFVMEPLFEIEPDFLHPIFKKTVREIYLELKRRSIENSG
ncbi:MAG: 2-amino-4-hydroxy-6-hydroxymethyldihydropteridine diphosphokinase [Dictyoglomus sp.]|nr:2-amino-4-hydroxy-6-hydroxymethyldihydropteridine diphosphokinase [Dictyoglomus sp.]MDW8188823.1 2-amino-4-hydroxy-6-hydroxymethyldihydropteridine diphosphokinase [Dictyoglomus sp.]